MRRRQARRGIPGPKPGGRVAGGGSGRHNGPPVPLPPQCGAIPPGPLPGRTDGDNGDHGARAAARGDAGNGDPLRNDNPTAAAITGKADNIGQENNDCSGDNGEDNKNVNKWGRGA